MAFAKKCDICGCMYELYNTRSDSKKVNGLMFLNSDEHRKYWSQTAIDCCPECIQSIKDHVESLKSPR